MIVTDPYIAEHVASVPHAHQIAAAICAVIVVAAAFIWKRIAAPARTVAGHGHL